MVHIPGDGAEVFRILVLDDQGLGGLGAGDTLIECAGDLGIHFPYLPVPVEDAVLEISGQHRDNGNDQGHHQGQLPVQDKHGRKAAAHIEQGPQDVRQVPGDHTGDAVGIAHDPGDQIAHRGHVVEGKGQGLQMMEQVPAQVPAHIHFDVHGVPAKAHHAQGLDQNHGKVQQTEHPNAVERILFNEIADGIPLKQGQQDVVTAQRLLNTNMPMKSFLYPESTGPSRFQIFQSKDFVYSFSSKAAIIPRLLPR